MKTLNPSIYLLPGNFVGKSGCDDEWVKYDGINKTLVFMGPSRPVASRTIVKYVNTITLMDATYKTM